MRTKSILDTRQFSLDGRLDLRYLNWSDFK